MRVRLIGQMGLADGVWYKPDYTRHDSEIEVMLSAFQHGCRTESDFISVMENTSSKKVIDRVQGALKIKPYPHYTMAGFTDWIFEIRGVSRALTHQLVRHRTAWFLQQSQRSVNPTRKEKWYVIPPKIQASVVILEMYEAMMDRCKKRYQFLVSKGVSKEDARFILPNATKTNIFMKMDGSNLMHFLKLRKAKEAQWEIRELAEKIHEAVKKVAPNLFSEDLEEFWW